MNAAEFIIDRMQRLVDYFKDARARYEYDALADIHTVEVFPQSVFESQAFLQWESQMFDEFVAAYPDEMISFISEDALVGIVHVDYSAEGIEYAPYNSDEQTNTSEPVVKILFTSAVISPSPISFNEEKGKSAFEQTVVSDSDFIINYRFAA